MFEVKIVQDSVWHTRLTTFQLVYPRFIHAELLTHRVFSRNSASSRAIPFAKMLDMTVVEPIHWGKNQPGMQAREEIEDIKTARQIWFEARDSAVYHAHRLAELGVHKQVVNRLIEPFLPISTVVTATDWANWEELRCHEDAQPETQHLATMMREAMSESIPIRRSIHLPYVQDDEVERYTTHELLWISAGRCAAVSYNNHEKVAAPKDLARAAKLWANKHLSPFEHAATAKEGRHANFDGWLQCRHMGVQSTG